MSRLMSGPVSIYGRSYPAQSVARNAEVTSQSRYDERQVEEGTRQGSGHKTHLPQVEAVPWVCIEAHVDLGTANDGRQLVIAVGKFRHAQQSFPGPLAKAAV